LVLLLPQLLELDRSQVAKRTVKTFMIGFAPPVLEEHLGLEQ
jgi:hypothetical protein